MNFISHKIQVKTLRRSAKIHNVDKLTATSVSLVKLVKFLVLQRGLSAIAEHLVSVDIVTVQ